MTEPTYAGPWCAECGYPAIELATSIDPRYPFGHCKRGDVGCNGGRSVALVLDKDAANAAYDRRRRRLTTARHAQHKPSELPEFYCDHCPHSVAELIARYPGSELARKSRTADTIEGRP